MVKKLCRICAQLNQEADEWAKNLSQRLCWPGRNGVTTCHSDLSNRRHTGENIFYHWTDGRDFFPKVTTRIMILKGIRNFPSTRDRVIFGQISVLMTLIWPLAPSNLSTGDPWMTLSHGKSEKWIHPNLNWNCKLSLIVMTTHAKSRVFLDILGKFGW